MEREREHPRGHVLVLIIPTQGHINPLLQFAKRLASKGLKVTIATAHYTVNSIDAPGVIVEPISDGFDEGGFSQAPSLEVYEKRFEDEGSKTLTHLIQRLKNSGEPVNCLVYDTYVPWALHVAKQHGLYAAAFSTTSAGVSSLYNQAYHGLLNLSSKPEDKHVLVPGFPPMELSDLPSFLMRPVSYPVYLASAMNQFSNLEMADWVLGNTFQELEGEVVKVMSKLVKMITIGPMVPSIYLDGRIEGDARYGANLWKPIGKECLKWLDTKSPKSVIYVSFGSMVELTAEQLEEIRMGLKGSNKNFIWVLKESERSKLPNGFLDSIDKIGLVVTWCSQLEVLAHKGIGCFITHCGWNSILEGLSLGVPMVGLPQWTDQPTNATFVEKVWKVGLRANVDENGIVRREELQRCVMEVMEGERNKEIKRNATKWRELAKEAISEGGSSDKNIDKFIEHILNGSDKRERRESG